VSTNGHPTPRPEQAPDPWGDAIRGRGGRIGTLRGRPAVLDFGDGAREAAALGDGCILVPLFGRTVVAVEGKDRIDYLQRMLTQDVAELVKGRGARAAFLNPGGRILGTMLHNGVPILQALNRDFLTDSCPRSTC
jgi:glycine cleavage system aminomethyltransferase T